MNAPAPRWHLPQFDNWLCASGTMNDRERLGLPAHHSPTDLQRQLVLACRDLRMSSVPDLLAIIGDADEMLARRIAAGNLLALAGDPRLDPLAPEMVTFTGGTVAIGLDPALLEEACTRLAGLGLDRSWLAKECPRHDVTLTPFRLARFAVTNGEYEAFLLATQFAEIPSGWQFRRFPAERANHPVYTVSPKAADAYAAWLAEQTGRPFRLPSEAEWEHAAAGLQGREFPWGDGFDPALANTAECGLFDTSPVGAFIAGNTPEGLADMAGNVEEYVADSYAPYPGGDLSRDHLVEIHGTYRVARGGGFSRFRDLARTRRRHGHNPRSATYAMGFRLAETVPERIMA